MTTLAEKIAVMQAFERGGEKIESRPIVPNAEWEVNSDPIWDWIRCDYRIAKPAPKQIKLEAWLTSNGELVHYNRELTRSTFKDWTRVPNLDLIGEVEQ